MPQFDIFKCGRMLIDICALCTSPRRVGSLVSSLLINVSWYKLMRNTGAHRSTLRWWLCHYYGTLSIMPKYTLVTQLEMMEQNIFHREICPGNSIWESYNYTYSCSWSVCGILTYPVTRALHIAMSGEYWTEEKLVSAYSLHWKGCTSSRFMKRTSTPLTCLNSERSNTTYLYIVTLKGKCRTSP